MVAHDKGHIAILDGFPRSPDQVRELLAAAEIKRWSIEIIYLSSNIEWTFRSLAQRMKKRFATGNRGDIDRSDLALFEGKTLRAIRQDIPAVRILAASSVHMISLDAGLPTETVASHVLDSLNIRPEMEQRLAA